MITETEGIVLRQTKIAGGRRMILIFTKQYGKISAGTSLNEKGKGKQALALRPFTYGNYQLYTKGDFCSINSGDPIASFYGIGEDVDKYMNASYAMELTDKITAEGMPSPGLFNLTVDMLKEMEKRKRKYGTIVLAYAVKSLKYLGITPLLECCAGCGANVRDIAADGAGSAVMTGHDAEKAREDSKTKPKLFFSIEDGGIVCEKCRAQMRSVNNDTLIYEIDFGIIDILRYFLENPLDSLRKLALEEEVCKRILKMITEYMRYHFGFGELKSEIFVTG